MSCTTHHHACDCRERKLLETMGLVALELRDKGLKGNDVAFQAFVDIDEMWLELYGCSITDDKRFTQP